MNTGHNSKQTTCFCRDTGGKGALPAQHTTFSTLDNWGHKTPTQSKRKRTGKKRYPSLISLMVSVDVKHHVYLLTYLSLKLFNTEKKRGERGETKRGEKKEREKRQRRREGKRQ